MGNGVEDENDALNLTLFSANTGRNAWCSAVIINYPFCMSS